MRPSRPLHVQIYAAVLTILLVFISISSIAWVLIVGVHRHRVAVHETWMAALLAVAILIVLGSYPLARRLTSRLERLESRVEALGKGDLSARVDVEGDDEIASLARSFNGAAERIERLVTSQRRMLAGASHELRSPLARIRVAVELLVTPRAPSDTSPRSEGGNELIARISSDIAELDELIGELLLWSRLEAFHGLERPEDVDLLALLVEEAARTGGEAGGEALRVSGDARLLRRLVRNLLENARRHGGGSPVEAEVTRAGPKTARLLVLDRGPGVPEDERERIFEPFRRLPGASEGDGGVGLGLALVRQIARQHGGEVRCLARGGGGTAFEVLLPAIELDTTETGARRV